MRAFKSMLIFALLMFMGSAQAQDTYNNTSTTTTNNNTVEKKSTGAGVFLEPILFTAQEDSIVHTSLVSVNSNNSSNDENTYGVGLRLGAHINDIVFLGADARYAQVNLNDSFYGNTTGNFYNYGPMVGVQTPYLGVRLLATYVVGGAFNPNPNGQGLQVQYTNPNGWRVGAGVHIAAVAINLEYEDLNYNSSTIQSFGSLAADTSASVTSENRGYSLSLSFPMAL